MNKDIKEKYNLKDEPEIPLTKYDKFCKYCIHHKDCLDTMVKCIYEPIPYYMRKNIM